MNNKIPTLLCILDGFGLNPNPKGNAVYLARKPNFDRLYNSAPSSTLITFGERVGLPQGQMGNSEVGHLNIGAGRVVEQSLLRISNALKGDFLNNCPEYQTFLKLACLKQSKIHLLGLFSDGGVHSHSEHFYLLLEKLLKGFDGKIILHIITDGRDTGPKSALNEVRNLESKIAHMPRVEIASLCGRFFAMDRDKRWERTEKAYRCIALAQGENSAPSASSAIEQAYAAGNSDEFIEPVIIKTTPINENDFLIAWNFREDRVRQIIQALCINDFSAFKRMAPIFKKEHVLCFTEYDAEFKLPFLIKPIEIKNHLGEYLSSLQLTQLRVAETEKYPHVTYFFNAGIEEAYSGETRHLIPSPRDVKTYDLKPEMSAMAVTEVVLKALQDRSYDFIVVNLANCDMVGHTGVLQAAIKAVEVVDDCLGKMLVELERANGRGLVIADHGNAEQMINYADGSPHTAHTTYPVPVIALGQFQGMTLRPGGALGGALCDVAPTLLKMMGLKKPSEMSGEALY